MNITEDYCSFEVAKLLKDKGFNDPFTHMFINKDNVKFDCSSSGVVPKETIACPTHQMAMKWLREVHKIVINVFDEHTQIASPTYTFTIMDYTAPEWNEHIKQYLPTFREQQYNFNKYEEAVEAAIKYTLENLI